MATLLDAGKALLGSLLYGPPARTYLPPIEARVAHIERKYSWQYPPGWALSSATGMLVHGPGVYPWGQRQAVGDAASNSVVYACLRTLGDAFTDAPLRHYRGQGDDKQVQEASSLADLFARPNPYFSLRLIEKWTISTLHIHGNAYWRKLRNTQTGLPVQLWPISPFALTPITEKGSSNFIDYYEFRISQTQKVRLPIEDVVHFRMGLDDQDHRLGLAPLRQLVREVASDREALRWAAAMLANGAMPGGLVVPASDVRLTRQEALDMRDLLQEQFGGDNLGRLGVLNAGGDFKRLAYTPAEMDLTVIHRIPETRICAVLGVPAGKVGLAAGLEHNTYSNAEQADEAFYEGTISPLFRDVADVLNLQLLPDFGPRADEYVAYDMGDVSAFAEDQDALSTRVVTQYAAHLITLNEARGELGYPPRPEPEADQIAAPPPTDPQATDQGAQDGQGPMMANNAAAGTRAGKAAGVTIADIPGLMDEVRAALQPQAVRHFRAYQDGQAWRVRRAVGD